MPSSSDSIVLTLRVTGRRTLEAYEEASAELSSYVTVPGYGRGSDVPPQDLERALSRLLPPSSSRGGRKRGEESEERRGRTRLDRYSVRRLAIEAMISPDAVERALREDHGDVVRMMGRTVHLLGADSDWWTGVDPSRIIDSISGLARELHERLPVIQRALVR